MKIISLIKSEFLKNYSIKKLVIISLIMLMVSIGTVELNTLLEGRKNLLSVSTYPKQLIEELRQKENKTMEDEYNLKVYGLDDELTAYLVSIQATQMDYRMYLADDIHYAYAEKLAIEVLKEHYDNPVIRQICNSSQNYFDSLFEGEIHHVCTAYEFSELNQVYQENIENIEDYSKLLKENKYYLYVKYRLEQGFFDSEDLEIVHEIIENKVEDPSDYLALNYIQYNQLGSNALEELDSLEEFTRKGPEYYDGIKNYSDYVRYNTFLKKEAIQKRSIVSYSSKHKIPHDISFNDYDKVYQEQRYLTAKSNVNLIFHYSVIVMILVSITSSGIVSKEHSQGTIKNIITAPVRRWKILFSKFIYLILHTYLIWLIGLFFLSMYSGMKYGFHDLLTPKLLYMGNHVVEVNYYLYLLKELFIASIPVICYLSILFFFSTVTLNTSLTVGITSILAIVSPLLWYLCDSLKLRFLVYTPFLFLDMGFFHGRYTPYVSIIKQVDISYARIVIISLMITFVIYGITNIIYSKRNIKN